MGSLECTLIPLVSSLGFFLCFDIPDSQILSTFFLFLIEFRETGERERKREREEHQFVVPLIYWLILFLKISFIFRERVREREREKHQCVVASHTPPTGDLAHNSGMFPDWELNW